MQETFQLNNSQSLPYEDDRVSQDIVERYLGDPSLVNSQEVADRCLPFFANSNGLSEYLVS